jgi:hypothetical protein
MMVDALRILVLFSFSVCQTKKNPKSGTTPYQSSFPKDSELKPGKSSEGPSRLQRACLATAFRVLGAFSYVLCIPALVTAEQEIRLNMNPARLERPAPAMPSVTVYGVENLSTGDRAMRRLESMLQHAIDAQSSPIPLQMVQIIATLSHSIDRIAAEIDSQSRSQIAGGAWAPES